MLSVETVGANEAKTHLYKLIERVIKGERITITKHGKPVAILHPVVPEKKIDTKSAINGIRSFRENNTLSKLSILEMTEKGR